MAPDVVNNSNEEIAASVTPPNEASFAAASVNLDGDGDPDLSIDADLDRADLTTALDRDLFLRAAENGPGVTRQEEFADPLACSTVVYAEHLGIARAAESAVVDISSHGVRSELRPGTHGVLEVDSEFAAGSATCEPHDISDSGTISATAGLEEEDADGGVCSEEVTAEPRGCVDVGVEPARERTSVGTDERSANVDLAVCVGVGGSPAIVPQGEMRVVAAAVSTTANKIPKNHSSEVSGETNSAIGPRDIPGIAKLFAMAHNIVLHNSSKIDSDSISGSEKRETNSATVESATSSKQKCENGPTSPSVVSGSPASAENSLCIKQNLTLTERRSKINRPKGPKSKRKRSAAPPSENNPPSKKQKEEPLDVGSQNRFATATKIRSNSRMSTNPVLLSAHLERTKAGTALNKATKAVDSARASVEECLRRLQSAREVQADAEEKQRQAAEKLAKAEQAVETAELSLDIGWNGWYKRLEVYREKNGHCFLPYHGVEDEKDLASKVREDPNQPGSDEEEEKLELAMWCSLQRVRLSRTRPDLTGLKLSGFRRHLLDRLDFEWDEDMAYWKEGLFELIKYKEAHGTIVVSKPDTDGPHINLWRWVQQMRTLYRSDRLNSKQIKLLEEIGFQFNQVDKKWDSYYQQLVNYHQLHGTCLVAGKENEELRKWCWKQAFRFVGGGRGKKTTARAKMRIQKLDDLGFEWDQFLKRPQPESEEEIKHGAAWLRMYRRLVAFKQEFGHTCVPSSTKEEKYKGLALWVSRMREWYKNTTKGRKGKGILSDGRIQLLNEIGFQWTLQGDLWRERYAALVAYKEQHGHTRVPASHKELNLGSWVQKLRMAYKAWREGKAELKRSLTQERIQLLEEIGFEWNLQGLKQDAWDERLQELIEYKRKNGNCNVPSKYAPNMALGHWVRNNRMCYKARFQKRRKGGATPLSDERVRVLNALEFEWRVPDKVMALWQP